MPARGCSLRSWAKNFAMGRPKEIPNDERNAVDEAHDEMLLVGGGRLAKPSRLDGLPRANVASSNMALLIGGGGRKSTPSCFVGGNPNGAGGHS